MKSQAQQLAETTKIWPELMENSKRTPPGGTLYGPANLKPLESKFERLKIPAANLKKFGKHKSAFTAFNRHCLFSDHLKESMITPKNIIQKTPKALKNANI